MTYIKHGPLHDPFYPNGVWPTNLPTTDIKTTTTVVSSKIEQSLGFSFKPKRPGTKTSHVVFVLDDSASMQSCRDTTISGYNEFLETQKADAVSKNIPTFVSLYKFDGDNVTGVFVRKSVAECEPLSFEQYNPQGMTNLNDAIGGVMMNINADLKKTAKADRDSIIVVILTDGQENSSRSFRAGDIKQMVSKAQEKNWGFIFLGANIDAYATGNTYGFSKDSIVQYNTSKMGGTMRAASGMVSSMKSAYASGMTTESATQTAALSDTEKKDLL